VPERRLGPQVAALIGMVIVIAAVGWPNEPPRPGDLPAHDLARRKAA
jgi:hypothetical protein